MRATAQRTAASPMSDLFRARGAALPPKRRQRTGNQAALRATAHAKCAACEEREQRGPSVRRQSAPPEAVPEAAPAAPVADAAAAPPARATSEDVWGLRVTRAMCGCRDRIRAGIAWANEAAATYAACNVPANATSTDVEACFARAHPTAVVVATTSSSGVVTLPPPSADPCDRIDQKATLVHETMHARHADAMARARGTAFFKAWQALAGHPDRLGQLRAKFPAEVAAFEAQWDNGADWASDEVNSYTWERRFLQSALTALNRIC